MNNDLRFFNYFLFTQYSISTFEKCPLKFKKRYLEGIKWKSVISEEIKRRSDIGRNFHLMARRYFLGIDTGLTSGIEGYEELSKWLEALKSHFPKTDDALYLPEYKLRMAKGTLRLEANFDLVVIKNDGIEIWDWKTQGKSKSNKPWDDKQKGERLKGSLQTMVYLFVLKEQAQRVVQREIECSDIRMFYWHPDPARILAEINYSDEIHEQFGQALKSKIDGILQYDYESFDKELYKKNCLYCEFNWFCNNERVDFQAVEEDEDFLEELDWDSIEELR
ncbi:PD-(D/E)XK nuclease family protein [Acetivibrio straminisolvens]|jgi:CRISPR/Cas system-associated exonuclease Cas4 (RecB family)|uniref:PD-(D/E)XK endonuclease-like domain-containing protein n=1 Tax=Acetivibrio straminisolvens JCM 21531 TaxID=1294263 RepID=W4V1P2_9FIRM|nr:PD-(D/E)XK nuclease family protein [Acetivibrio straminisolvens]GAE87012.1 hypothetical protein JCM21531_351 [Acetivibrio straminisolvens JCM 21531]